MVSTGFPETVEHLQILRAQNRAEMVIKLLETPARENHENSASKDLSYKVPENLIRLFEGQHFYSDNSANDYMNSVERSIEYINAGDSFQVNLSQRFWHPKFCEDRLLYELLSKVSPAPFRVIYPHRREIF